jgi:hypothetical protein
VKEHFRPGIIDQRLQFTGRHSPVHRYQHRAQLGAGKQQLEELDAVAAEDGDPVAGANAEIVHQAGRALRVRLEFGIGERRAADKVTKRDSIRRQLRALRRNVGYLFEHFPALPSPAAPYRVR